VHYLETPCSRISHSCKSCILRCACVYMRVRVRACVRARVCQTSDTYCQKNINQERKIRNHDELKKIHHVRVHLEEIILFSILYQNNNSFFFENR